MRKKALILILVFALSEIGCAGAKSSLKEKFIRNKKQEEEVTQLIRVGEDEAYPNKVRYKMHYIYWDAWMTALINYIGESPKRDLANCRRALEDLNKMSSFLTEDKAVTLEPYIESLEREKKEIMLGGLDAEADKRASRRKLKKLRDEVRHTFSPEKIDEEWIKPDPY